MVGTNVRKSEKFKGIAFIFVSHHDYGNFAKKCNAFLKMCNAFLSFYVLLRPVLSSRLDSPPEFNIVSGRP